MPNKKQIGRTSTSKTVNVPAAVGTSTRSTGAKMTASGTSIRVRHREFFGTLDTYGSSAPYSVVYGWTIQPSYGEMFPWLSAIASNYEKYTLHSLSFEYVPRCSTSSIGTVVMSYDQDPNDPFPTEDDEGRRRMLASVGSMSAPVWSPVKVTVPPSVLSQVKERFLISSGETVDSGRFSHTGMLWAGIFGSGTAITYGDLVVSYDITLSVPQILPLVSTPAADESFIHPVTCSTEALDKNWILEEATPTVETVWASTSDLFESFFSPVMGQTYLRYLGTEAARLLVKVVLKDTENSVPSAPIQGAP